MKGSVVHFEVPFDDAERARAFYRDVFGWDIQHMPEFNYDFVQTGPVSEESGLPTEPGYIGGGMFKRSEAIDRPVLTLDVEDIEVALSDIKRNGGSQVGEPAQVGEMGRAAYFRDSEGNLMGLWQSA